MSPDPRTGRTGREADGQGAPAVVVAIPTFLRPDGLERLLKALAGIECPRRSR